MRCLLCHKEIGSDDVLDLLIRDDVLCHSCRMKWPINIQYQTFFSKPLLTLYDYDSGYKDALIQLKSRYDEAIAPAFLCSMKKIVRKYIRGYHVYIAPSSKYKRELRGFHHLGIMLDSIKIPYEDIFLLKNEESQQGKSKQEREHQKDNIYISHPPSHKKICLFDDQMTTGATIQGMINALPKETDIKILCLSKGNLREH